MNERIKKYIIGNSTWNNMNTNETIAKWLGWKQLEKERLYPWKTLWSDNEGRKHEYLDFLHDRNQQKRIEDELIKDGYCIVKRVRLCYAIVVIEKELTDRTIKVLITNEIPDLDQAFIEAVLELIKKEEIK